MLTRALLFVLALSLLALPIVPARAQKLAPDVSSLAVYTLPGAPDVPRCSLLDSRWVGAECCVSYC